MHTLNKSTSYPSKATTTATEELLLCPLPLNILPGVRETEGA